MCYFQSINQELEEVEAIVRKVLKVKKAEHVALLTYKKFSRLNQKIRPAMVIYTAELFSYKKENIFQLAAVMQLLYTASQIHTNIADSDSPTAEEINRLEEYQLPVLLGDYLFGQCLSMLVKGSMTGFIATLAKIICSVHDVAATQTQYQKSELSNNPELLHDMMHRDSGQFFAGCCSLAAKISGANKEEVEVMHEFGLHVGVGYGLLEWGAPIEQAQLYFAKAREVLDQISRKAAKDKFYALLEMLENDKQAIERLVV